MAIALFPGTFDPCTLGHLELVRRGAALFDRLIVAVGAREEKRTLFDAATRVALFREATKGIEGVTVEAFDGLVVDFARRTGASVLLRGVRNATDYEYEAQMAVTNARLLPGIETILLVADPRTAFLSSSLIKEVTKAGGKIDEFVPPAVVRALANKR
ncbi:MAG: pantetheine-phosphate adenylyltransferase [Planctomycetes bacterium]|nr:pantetheine-phosphate adenylyltransferase [Planctomycetota bacterium]